MEAADRNTWDFFNVVKIDGIKGANGSFVPYGDSPLAALNPRKRHFQLFFGTTFHQFIQFLGTLWYPTPHRMFSTKI